MSDGTSNRRVATAAFHTELRDRNLPILRWSTFVFVPLYLAWSGFDYLLAREEWRFFLGLRITGAVVNSALVIAVHRPRLQRWVNQAFWLWLFVFGALIVPMLARVSESYLAYVLGFTIVLFGAGLLPHWQPRWALSNVLSILAVLGVVFVLSPPKASQRELVSMLFFIATTTAMSLVMASSKYLMARKDFFTRRALSDERLMSERLRAADRLKDEFLATVSHELRTPLNGIIGLSESMLDGAGGQTTLAQRENLKMIVSSGRRLAALVNDILDLSRLKNHEVTLSLKAVDVRAVADVVLALLTPLLAHKPVELVNRIDASSPAVLADEDRLQQILINLVGNAIKFTEAGSISISARAHPDRLEVTVADTGIGIPSEKLGIIFESFEQADASIARVYGGTGLGLTVTRKLVELHGGKIDVTSEVNRGSSFTFALPLAQEGAELQPAPGTPPRALVDRMEASTALGPSGVEGRPSSPPTSELASPQGEAEPQRRGARILVVDDEPVNLRVIANQLSLHDYRIHEASSGADALRWVEEHGKPDLVLLDVMMPRLSGYEVLRTLRRSHSATELPVILLTAKNQVADVIEGFDAGANDYLAKPIAKGELLSRIKTHLHLSQLCSAYGRFVPLEFIRHLERDSILDVDLGDHIQKTMAVMFTDIRSFTTLSEDMSPEQNFNFLNSYLRRVAPVIAANQGFIDQYIGDAVMALFPGSIDDAVSAAVELRGVLRQYNDHRAQSGYRPIQLGTGVHIGPLILGTIGYEQRMQTTVISDSVNLASRLEGLTKRFGVEVIVSDAVLNALDRRERFELRSLGRMRVKGKRREVSIFELLSGAPEPELEARLRTRRRFERGIEHMLAGELGAAVAAFREVLREDPTDPAATYLLESTAYLSRQRAPLGSRLTDPVF